MDDDERRVLNTLLAQTNAVQGEWVSKRVVKTALVAHGPLSGPAVEEALHRLFQQERIEADNGTYRVADGVDRVPHPGEC